MKTFNLLGVVIAVCFSSSAFGQLVHTKGIQAVELNWGMSRYGVYGGGYYIYHLSNKFYLKGGVYFEKANIKSKLRTHVFGIDAMAVYNFYKQPGKFYINGVGGVAILLGEKDNTGFEGENKDQIQKSKTGLLGGVELEYFINGRWSIIGTGIERWYRYNGQYGKFRWTAGLGIRYNF